MTSLTAGSVATGKCRSFWLEDRYKLPVRSTPEDITSFISFWASFVSIRHVKEAAARGLAHPKRDIPPTEATLVFTHHDLAPRNILLDSHGKIWLLDWDYAGFYPSYFEYASMQNFFMPHSWNWLAQKRWHVFTLITVGRFERERRMLQKIRSRFTRFPVGRRFELLAKGGPSGRPVT